MIRWWCRRSEPDVETNRVIANGGRAQELVGAEVEPAVLIDLRIETGVVGPRLEVAAGERQRGSVEAESCHARHVALRNAEAQRYLTQLGEARILDVADVGAHQPGDI